MKIKYWILATLALVTLTISLNAQPRKVKITDDPAIWISQHGHYKLGKFAGKMMKIDWNIDLGKGKGKKR